MLRPAVKPSQCGAESILWENPAHARQAHVDYISRHCMLTVPSHSCKAMGAPPAPGGSALPC